MIESGPRDDHYLDLEKGQIADWEDASLGVWLELCKHSNLAIDVGAYLGIYSIMAAKVGCPKVLAIEPNPKAYEQLKRNIFLNLLGCEISTQQVAVGESDELVALTFPYGRPFSSGAKISQEFENQNSNHYDTQTDIQMVTLDSLIKTTNEEVVVLKIDAEGFELQILKGATHLLATNFPQIIVEILSDQQKVEVDQFLQNFGYKKGVPIQDSAKTSNMLYMIN